MLSSTSVLIAETAPQKLMGIFGSLINFGVVLALSLYMFLASAVPTDEAQLMTTNIWRWLFALPAFTSVIVFILFFTLFKKDSILFLIKQGKEEAALEFIKRIYKPVTEDTHQQILNEMTKAIKNEPTSRPGFKEVLTDPEYRTATWVGIYLCLSNQLTGVTGISQYSL